MSPITPPLLVVEIDDELLPVHQLLPHAAVVAAVAGAGQWYQLHYDPKTSELRYLHSPTGPERTPEVLRRRGNTVQIKTPGPHYNRWVPAGYALARQFLTIAQLPLPGRVTALRSMVGRGGAQYRVDLQLNSAGEADDAAEFAGATFAANPGGGH